MADTVEGEAARLGRLTSRLLRIARLDRENIKPRSEQFDISTLASHTVDQYARQFPDRRLSIAKARGGSIEVLADQELLRLALSQLVENACKYSSPGAFVRVSIEPRDKSVSVSVSNTGSSIPANEKRLVFDRFYRGAEVKNYTAGSGLGLYVARKIALAHGGTLDLESAGPANNSVTFRLEIPSPVEESVPADAAK
jgi:two-component system sensor histidine kinase KdpD